MPVLPPDFAIEAEWLRENVAAERSKNGVTPRAASFAGAPWSRQDDYDLRYLLEYEGRSEPEIARFLQREPREIDDRIKACRKNGGWRPVADDDKIINLVKRAGQKRWHK